MAYPENTKRRAFGPGTEIPEFDPLAGRGPAPLPGSQSVGARLGRSVADLPGEVVTAGRNAFRDPVGALGAATAPLPGIGGGLRSLYGAGRVAAGTAASARSAGVGAGQLLRNMRPSWGQQVAAVGSLGAGGVALGQVDQASMEGDDAPPAYVPQNRGGPRTRAKIDSSPGREAERQRAFADRAKEADYLPQVDTGQAPDRISLRGNQGAVIENPHQMSTTDKLNFASKTFKGSPSMRRAAADAIVGEAAGKDLAHQAALQRNADGDMAQAAMQTRANEAFADRRLKAQAVNAGFAEDRRSGDLDRQVDRESSLLTMAGRIGAGKKGGAGSDFANAVYDDYVKAGYTPEQAAQMSTRASSTAGVDPSDSDYSRWGQTQEEDAITRGRQGYTDRWFASNRSGFDQSSAVPRSQKWNEKIVSAILPGQDREDVVWEDQNGRRNRTASDAVPAGETAESYALRRMRERALQGR